MAFRDRDTHVARGVVANTIILSELVRKGYEVLLPWGDDRRYDLAYIEPGSWFKGAHLVRVQCKRGWLERENGTIVFNTVNVSVRPGRNHHIRNYRGDVEMFAVYVPDIEKVYMVPVDMTSSASKGYLRLAPTKNNQKKNIVWASDFELR